MLARPTPCAVRTGVAERLTLARRRSREGGGGLCLGPAHTPASGRTQPPGARSPSGAHPRAGVLRLPGARTPLDALLPAAWASARCAHPAGHTHRGRCGTGQARLASPAANTTRVPAFARGKKKKRLLTRRGLWCVGRGSIAKPRGRVLALISSKGLGQS